MTGLLRGTARALAALVLGLAMLGPIAAHAPVAAQEHEEVSADYFYDTLDDQGTWVDHWRYGRVWYPSNVDDDWRPYTRGRWVLTDDYGWYWESYERFGWATYHYGRWAFDEDYGWIWIPGRDWGPAWVDWRRGGDVIGWAPLPPEVSFHEDRFDYGGVELVSEHYRPTWCFVPLLSFTSGDVYRHVLPPSRNVTIIRNTTNITNYSVVNNTIINRSVNVTELRNATHTDIRPVKVMQSAQPVFAGRGSVHSLASPVAVFRPEVKAGLRPPPVSRVAVPLSSGGRLTSGAGAGQGTPQGAQGAVSQTSVPRPVPQIPRATQGGFPRAQPAQGTPPVQGTPQPRTAAAAPAAPSGPDPRAAEAARLRALERHQAEEAARQQREQAQERAKAQAQAQAAIAQRHVAERQEMERLHQNQRVIEHNRAAIAVAPQPRPAPQPQPRAAPAPQPKPAQAQPQRKEPPPGPPGQPH